MPNEPDRNQEARLDDLLISTLPPPSEPAPEPGMQDLVLDSSLRMLPPRPEPNGNDALGTYSSSCYCHPCQLTRNYRRLLYAYENQELGDANPRGAYRYARRIADRVDDNIRTDATASRADREGWDEEFRACYTRWARGHAMYGYSGIDDREYHVEYSESGNTDDVPVPFVGTPTGYEPPVEINFASANIDSQVHNYETQVRSAKSTINMAASELKGGRLALKGLYVQQVNARTAVKTSDDLASILHDMPEVIGIKYGPCTLPGGERLSKGELEVVFLPVLYSRRSRDGIQKRVTTPVSFRITKDGRMFGAGRVNYHPHLKSEGICLGRMRGIRGYGSGSSVESILSTLASINDIGGMLRLMSAWRLGHNPRDELSRDWRFHAVRNFFNEEQVRTMWPEWDGTTVQYAPRGIIGPLDRWLPGILNIKGLTRTEIGQAIYLRFRTNRSNLSPYLDSDLVAVLNNIPKKPCRICYNTGITLALRYATTVKSCLGCMQNEDVCSCPANRFKVSQHQVQWFPRSNMMFYPVRPPPQVDMFPSQPRGSYWWCAGRHEDYPGNYKYARDNCGSGPTLSANPLKKYAWLQCAIYSQSPWQFTAMEPQAMRCWQHSIGSMIGKRGELS